MAAVVEIVTPAQLAAHVSGKADDAWTIAAAAAANGAVLGYLGREYDDVSAPVPDEVFAATMTAAADVYHRRQAPLGISSALDLTGVPLRVTRDWLAGVAPVLDRYRDHRQAIG